MNDESELEKVRARLDALAAIRGTTGWSVDQTVEYEQLCGEENRLLGVRRRRGPAAKKEPRR